MSKMDEPDFAPKFAKPRRAARIDPSHCPLCNADLQGDEIPQKIRGQYERGKTHFSRVIWISSMARDAGIAYQCPDCTHQWAIPGREDWFAEHKAGET